MSNYRPKTAKELAFELGNYPIKSGKLIKNFLNIYSPGLFVSFFTYMMGIEFLYSFLIGIGLSAIGALCFILISDRSRGFDLYYKVLNKWDQERAKFEEGKALYKKALELKNQYQDIEEKHKTELEQKQIQINNLHSDTTKYNNQINNQDKQLKFQQKEIERLELKLRSLGNANEIKAKGAKEGFNDCLKMFSLKNSYNAIQKDPERKEAAKNEIIQIGSKYNYNPFK